MPSSPSTPPLSPPSMQNDPSSQSSGPNRPLPGFFSHHLSSPFQVTPPAEAPPQPAFQFRGPERPVHIFGGHLDTAIETPMAASSSPGLLHAGSSSPPTISTAPPVNSSRESQAPVFHFGSRRNERMAGANTNLDSTNFSFRVLHNTTPLPSPHPSPQPSFRALPVGQRTSFAASVITPNQYEEENAMDIDQVLSEPEDTSLVVPLASLAVTSPSDSANPPPLSSTVQAEINIPVQDSGLEIDSRDDFKVLIGRKDQVNAVSYDVRDEQAPSHRFFTPQFQSALQSGLGVANSVAESIMTFQNPATLDATMNKLLQDAKELRSFHGSDTRTIAVLGDSGEGKSSLINSLLDFPEIARTSDIGSACTSVVTEYRQKTTQHEAPITIEVEYLPSADIEVVVKDLLWSYRQLYLPVDPLGPISEQDYAYYERESAQAWSVLEAAFKHKSQFKEESLRDMSEGASERLTDQLVQWSREIEWPEGGHDGLWKSSANTAKECCDKTEIFMKDRYWPFTKIIRIHLNAQVLKTGVVLTDLPGLQDTNLARVRTTQSYLMRCNNIFIVGKISRAVTDLSIKSSLFSVLSRHVPLEWEESGAKSLNIAVVCTKSEDINLEKARETFCGNDKRIPSSVIEHLDGEIAKAKAAGNRTLKKELKRKRELILIEARNAHVIDGLRAAYAAKVPGGDLDVFCVSNKLYEKHSRKGNAVMVAASGIPELRRFCHSITAEAQLREARHFLQASLFNLVNSLQMWAESWIMAQREEAAKPKMSPEKLIEALAQMSSQATSAITKLTSDFKSCFQEQVLTAIDRRYQYWETAAEVEGKRWMKWHTSQYNAWCRRNGKHKTKLLDEDWNAKIIWKMRIELDYQWDIVEEEISNLYKKLEESLEQLFADLKKAGLESSPVEFHTFLAGGLDSRIKTFQYKLRLSKTYMTDEVKFTRRCATDTNYNSYILSEMIPTYRDASSHKGSGMSRRQQAIVQERITDGILFQSMGVTISDCIDDVAKKRTEDLLQMLVKITRAIRRDFDIVLASCSNIGREDTFKDLSKVQELLETVKGLKARVVEVAELSA